MRLAAAALIFLGVALWLVGGNIIVALHYRRRKLPMESGFKPFAFPFGHFAWFEWVALAVLAVLCLASFGLGIEFQQSRIAG